MRSSAIAITLLTLLTLGSLPLDARAGQIHPSLYGPNRYVLPGDSIDVWVFFADRGFDDPSLLQQALAKAEQDLTLANKNRRQKVRPNQLVDERDLPIKRLYTQAVLDIGGRYRTVSRYLNALSLRAPRAVLGQIAQLSFVKDVRPVAKGWRHEPVSDWNSLPSALSSERDPLRLDYGPSYNQLNQINVIAAHDSGYSGSGVLVCLLDTGFFTDHEALITRPVIAEWDFINNDPETANQPGDPSGQHDHGTYTFSTLGGAHDGDLYGPAYGATFIIGKTESIAFEMPIEEDWYIAGLEWADSLGAQVVSTSLGYIDWYTFPDLNGDSCVTTIGVDLAVANGIVCVTAAGNERTSSWGHIIAPADADSVITVGAVNSQGVIASFSSPGPTYDGRIKPEVCARGVNTWCAAPWGSQPTTNYAGVGGTSLSTPLVGGACALLLEAHPNWTPMQVRTALMLTADNAQTPDNDYGWGVIDVMAAINFNFPPQIQQKHPNAGQLILYPGETQDFWVTALEPEGEAVTYDWWINSQYVSSSAYADSAFLFQADEAETVQVKVYVTDVRGGMDSTDWMVEVPYVSGAQPVAPELTPQQYALYENFPNPFNASTTLRYDLPEASQVSLHIFNMNGRLVTSFASGWQAAGRYHVSFEAKDLPAGIYFCRMAAGGFQGVVKMVYVK